MGVLWSSAAARADDAEDARQAAEADRTSATQRQLEADVEVATLRDELASVRAELADVPPAVDTAALDAEIEALETEIDRLATMNVDLTAFIEATSATQQGEPESVPVQAPPGPVLDPSLTPEFSRYVGELLSSRSGSSNLGQGQSECLGAAVINTIGVDALGAGLNNAATTTANDVVVSALQSAAAFCNIDPSLIFG
jgi:hypothetical protein